MPFVVNTSVPHHNFLWYASVGHITSSLCAILDKVLFKRGSASALLGLICLSIELLLRFKGTGVILDVFTSPGMSV